jgi:hypothetical protein
MSAETDFLSYFFDLRQRLDLDGDLRSLDETLGIEITIVEANPCIVQTLASGEHITTPGAGQKSYARGNSSRLEYYSGLHLIPGKQPPPTAASLVFPESDPVPVDRFYAYDTSHTDEYWELHPPFIGTTPSTFSNVTVSLLPPNSLRKTIEGESPDGAVHVYATTPGNREPDIILTDVRLDPVSKQLLGYGGSMAQQDQASLWVISFFIASRPPG